MQVSWPKGTIAWILVVLRGSLRAEEMATAVTTRSVLKKSPKKAEKPQADGFTIKASMRNVEVSYY